MHLLAFGINFLPHSVNLILTRVNALLSSVLFLSFVPGLKHIPSINSFSRIVFTDSTFSQFFGVNGLFLFLVHLCSSSFMCVVYRPNWQSVSLVASTLKPMIHNGILS